MAKAEGRFYN